MAFFPIGALESARRRILWVSTCKRWPVYNSTVHPLQWWDYGCAASAGNVGPTTRMSFRSNLTAMSRCESNPEGVHTAQAPSYFQKKKTNYISWKATNYTNKQSSDQRPSSLFFLLVSVCDTPTANWAI